MGDKSTRTLRSESSAVSLNLEHSLRGASLLAELLANHNLPDEESRRIAPHCIAAQLALVDARLRHLGRVIRGRKMPRRCGLRTTPPAPRHVRGMMKTFGWW